VERAQPMTGASTKPQLTVAISLFNYGHYIERALASVCEQTIASVVELIVVDDASTDNSGDVLHRFQRNYASLIARLAGFHCEIHERNRGLAEARNTAFHLANASSVLVLDADNFLLPQACSCLLRSLEAAPQFVGAVYPILAVQGHPLQGLANELPWDPQRFRTGNYIDALALVRLEAWQSVGGFKHTPGGWEDFDFWCRFVEHGWSAQQVPKLLGVYQHHSDSMKNSETALRQVELCELLQRRHPWLELTTP
jgi:glycosyltransferase involved in cell wall biosynthesis